MESKATDRFLSLFNSFDDGFCVIELEYDTLGGITNLHFQDVNKSFEKHSGLRNILNKSIKQLSSVAKTGEPAKIESYVEDIDRWYSVYASLIGNIGSKFVAVVFRDITETKNYEAKLQQTNHRLQEMDKAKTEFFNNVSHEFRTPLTLLISPLNDVIKSNKSMLHPDDVQRLQLSHRGAIRLQKLVNTLLDFSRIEAGKIEAFYQPTDFTKFTVELASQFKSAIEAAGLKYTVKAEDIAEPIYLNREMWEKIVFNLISNALKFTHHGKIQLIIHEKNRSVELRVKDTGVGIAKKNIDRIFERFARVDDTKGRVYGGTGIGLTLVRELVWAHKGNIKVRSEEGIGSEFIVSIPKGKSHLDPTQVYENKKQLPMTLLGESFVEEAAGWIAEDEKSKRRNEKVFQQDSGTRVLIADDNADMRQYLTGVLSDKYNVLALEHGRKLIDYLTRGGHADLIITDLMMPEMNGYEVVDFLKSSPKHRDIPIIMLSAKSTEEAKIEGLNLGADHYLFKPFSVGELRAVVRSCVMNAKASK